MGSTCENENGQSMTRGRVNRTTVRGGGSSTKSLAVRRQVISVGVPAPSYYLIIGFYSVRIINLFRSTAENNEHRKVYGNFKFAVRKLFFFAFENNLDVCTLKNTHQAQNVMISDRNQKRLLNAAGIRCWCTRARE